MLASYGVVPVLALLFTNVYLITLMGESCVSKSGFERIIIASIRQKLYPDKVYHCGRLSLLRGEKIHHFGEENVSTANSLSLRKSIALAHVL